MDKLDNACRCVLDVEYLFDLIRGAADRIDDECATPHAGSISRVCHIVQEKLDEAMELMREIEDERTKGLSEGQGG
jgi:hypothetical protein